jgi:transposase
VSREKQGECMSEPEDMTVGIDVAKATLEVAVRPSGDERHVANDSAGIAVVVAWLQRVQPSVMVVEATGGDEAPVVAELGVAGLRVAVVNPRQGGRRRSGQGSWRRRRKGARRVSP